jgi:DNA-binding transcriptional MocR family regulator
MTITAPQSPAIDWTTAFAGRTSRIRPSEIREFLKLLGQAGIISFAGGIPASELFPADALQQAMSSLMADPARRAQAMQYASSEGYAPLREWIARYMGRLGVECTSANIVITTGSQQGLDLIGKLFLDPGDEVLLPAPAYLGAIQAFNVYEPAYATIDLATGAMDSAGIPAFAYVVPDFANPSGETITLAQRHQLLDCTDDLNLPIVEDAAYQALRYEGEPVLPLLALDIERTGGIERSRVIYAGTFSKTISPGMRVGWLCAAEEVVRQIVLVRQAADLHGSILDQMLMAEIVTNGFDTQVSTILPVYRHRRDAMLAALDRFMPEGVSWTRPEGGMFIWLTLPEGLDSRALVRKAIDEQGIVFVPGTSFFADGSGERHIRLNYTCSDDATIDDGIGRLAALISQQCNPGVNSSDCMQHNPALLEAVTA